MHSYILNSATVYKIVKNLLHLVQLQQLNAVYTLMHQQY